MEGTTVNIQSKGPSYSVISKWRRAESEALIETYKLHKRDFNSMDRNTVWKRISLHLKKKNIHYSPEKCYVKWKGLMRTYRNVKNAKSINREVGFKSRFLFFNSMQKVVDGDTDDELVAEEMCLEEDSEDVPMEENTDDGIEQTNSKDDGSYDLKLKWGRLEIEALIDAYEVYEKQFGSHPRRDVWQRISAHLNSKNINYSPKKCHEKWKSLLRSYKNVKKTRFLSNRKMKSKFLFYDKLERVLENSDFYNVSCRDYKRSLHEETAQTKMTNPRSVQEVIEGMSEEIISSQKLKSWWYKEKLGIEKQKLELEKRKCDLLEKLLKTLKR